jgi:integrase
MKSAGIITVDNVANFSPLPIDAAVPELTAALRACPESPAGARNYAMILVMADAGLRASEVLRLLVGVWWMTPME